MMFDTLKAVWPSLQSNIIRPAPRLTYNYWLTEAKRKYK